MEHKAKKTKEQIGLTESYCIYSNLGRCFFRKNDVRKWGVGLDSSIDSSTMIRFFFSGLANFGGRPTIEGGLDSSKYGSY